MEKEDAKEVSKDILSERLGLMDFSGDENFSPEIIDDVLESVSIFDANIDIAAIAKRIKDNKARYYGAKP